MIRIKLTRGKFAVVDDDMGHLLNWKWHYGTNGYASRSVRMSPGRSPSSILMHHAVVGFPLYGLEVDHINGDCLNNKKGNLRIVPHWVNLLNSKRRKVPRNVLANITKDRYRPWYIMDKEGSAND